MRARLNIPGRQLINIARQHAFRSTLYESLWIEMHLHIGPVHGSTTKHPWSRSNRYRLVWACQCPAPKVLQTSVVIIAPGSAYRSTADKTRHSLFIHSFGFTAALILVGLVNSGSGLCTEHGILVWEMQQHHHYSYEIASGSVKVANS
jgi:hypothetical protein